MIRLYTDADLAAETRIELNDAQRRYLLDVMRSEDGSTLLIFNGRDGEWRASLRRTGKKSAVLDVQTCTRAQSQGPDLDLILALIKRAPLGTVIEKATELGVRRIRLALTRRTNAEHTRLDRLHAIAVEAAEQTGRLEVPEILAPVRLDALLDGWEGERRLMFCDEAGDDPEALWGGPRGRAAPALAALQSAGAGPWAILIGPEGGFDASERGRLRAAAFVTPVGLGPRILRADTAAISALTLWQAALGDWRPPEAADQERA